MVAFVDIERECFGHQLRIKGNMKANLNDSRVLCFVHKTWEQGGYNGLRAAVAVFGSIRAQSDGIERILREITPVFRLVHFSLVTNGTLSCTHRSIVRRNCEFEYDQLQVALLQHVVEPAQHWYSPLEGGDEEKTLDIRNYMVEEQGISSRQGSSYYRPGRRGPYTKYPLTLKTQAVQLVRAGADVRSAAKELGVPLKNLKRWVDVGATRKKGGGRKTLDPEMEAELCEWCLTQVAAKGKQLSRAAIKQKARFFSRYQGAFKASKGWLDKFIKRFQLQRILKVASPLDPTTKKIIPNYREQELEFQEPSTSRNTSLSDHQPQPKVLKPPSTLFQEEGLKVQLWPGTQKKENNDQFREAIMGGSFCRDISF